MSLIIINTRYLFFLLLLNSSCNLINRTEDNYFLLELSKNPKVNTKIYGELKYNSHLDTVKLRNSDYRSIRLYLGIFKKKHSVQELKSMKLDTFISLEENSKNIPFYLRFKEKGHFIIDGYVEDIVFLEDYYNDGRTRIITNEAKVTGNVEVIE